MSSEVSSHSDLVTWEFTLLRLDNEIARGQQLLIEFSWKFPGLNDDVLRETESPGLDDNVLGDEPRETWGGLRSVSEVD